MRSVLRMAKEQFVVPHNLCLLLSSHVRIRNFTFREQLGEGSKRCKVKFMSMSVLFLNIVPIFLYSLINLKTLSLHAAIFISPTHYVGEKFNAYKCEQPSFILKSLNYRHAITHNTPKTEHLIVAS